MGRFHEGELRVQDRAGAAAEAARLEAMLLPPQLSGGPARFLSQVELAVLTARDDHGLLWTSPLFGPPGFLVAQGQRLHIDAVPEPGDPLRSPGAGQEIGLVAIDLVRRRRFRVNGELTSASETALEVRASQAYGNCPRYIVPRALESGTLHGTPAPTRSDGLDDGARSILSRAETFFLGTAAPGAGLDSSHRGGPAGFVRIDGATLWWPDFPGNQMFNSLGNLAVDPTAALFFPDLEHGVAVQLSGTAVVEWVGLGSREDAGGTGRRVRFTPAHVVRRPSGLHAPAEPPTAQ